MRQTPNEIWLEVLEKLSDAARQDVYLHQAVPLSITTEALNIGVPSAYTRARIEERFRADIQRVLAHINWCAVCPYHYCRRILFR